MPDKKGDVFFLDWKKPTATAQIICNVKTLQTFFAKLSPVDSFRIREWSVKNLSLKFTS